MDDLVMACWCRVVQQLTPSADYGDYDPRRSLLEKKENAIQIIDANLDTPKIVFFSL